MDDIERRRIFQELKKKADAPREAERLKKVQKLRTIGLALIPEKQNAMNQHVLLQLGTPKVKPITQMHNRPAEKLAMQRTKGMKKGGKTPGRTGPGV